MALIRDRELSEDSWQYIEDGSPVPSEGGAIVPFDQFKDGRGYSTARLLRERFGFTGELRAVGDILRDQLAFLERCGFDSFEYAGGTAAVEALKAFDEIDIVYQTATDRRQSAAATRNHPSRAFSNGTSG